MTKLRTMLFILLFGMATSPVLADMGGPYLGVQASINGVSLDGTAINSNNETTVGTAGKVFGDTGIELGFAIPLGSRIVVMVGGQWSPAKGQINFDSGQGDGDASEDIQIHIEDQANAYIAPGFLLTENSMLYGKIGPAYAKLDVSGAVSSAPDELDGINYAIGLKTKTEAGLFIQVEGGAKDYTEISVTKSGSTGSATADPLVAYGAVTLGFQF